MSSVEGTDVENFVDYNVKFAISKPELDQTRRFKNVALKIMGVNGWKLTSIRKESCDRKVGCKFKEYKYKDRNTGEPKVTYYPVEYKKITYDIVYYWKKGTRACAHVQHFCPTPDMLK